MNANRFATYQEALEWIHGLLRFGQKPGLERVRWLLDRLGNPERRLLFIHVAGTNGKGSTCAYLNGVLRAAGYSTGMFTSPYLVDFRERIRYNDELIGEEDFRRLAGEIRPLVEACESETAFGSPTEFEVITVLAILYFATVVCPAVVIWETGLGGRLDSTNVVNPLVSVITNIGLDHTEILGDSIAAIAREKAGIIKPGVPVVTCEQSDEALSVIEESAASKRSTIYRLGKEFQATGGNTALGTQQFRYSSVLRREEREYTLSLNGVHQPLNAAAALMTLDLLRNYFAFLVEEEEIANGLQQTKWPGRLEIVGNAPLLLLDGAHNAEGMRALTQSVLTLVSPGQRVELLVSSLADKPLVHMAEAALPLTNCVDRITLTHFDFPRAASVEQQRDAWLTAGVDEQQLAAATDWKAFLDEWRQTARPSDCLIICGSLYFIAQVRAYLLPR